MTTRFSISDKPSKLFRLHLLKNLPDDLNACGSSPTLPCSSIIWGILGIKKRPDCRQKKSFMNLIHKTFLI